MLLVFGARGHIGSELVAILASKGVPATAITRNPERAPQLPGIRWVKADLGEPSSLAPVVVDVDGMFLLTANGADLARLQTNAIEAARRAGVPHVVKLSALGASDHSRSPIGRAHHEAETALIASGLPWTILRPHVFMQNLLDQASTIAREGRFYAASGDGKIPFIDARDIAAVAAATLTEPGHEGQKYVLTGPEALSYHDLASTLSDVLGHRVEYVADTLEEARERMVRAGAPSWSVEGALALAAYQRAGGPTAVVHDTVQRILGRPPRSFAVFARDHVAAFRSGIGPGP